MATLASLVVSLEANVARFESDLNKAEFMAKKAMDTISSVSESAMGAVKSAVAAMAAAYTFDAFADGIKGAIASAAELDHMAKKTGATVEALSGLKSAAKLSGTSLDEVGGGLQKLSKAMFEAAGGSQKQSDLFKSLGIEVTDSSGKLRDSGEVMLDLAKKLDSMDSSTQAVATAQMLLGKRGAQLLPFMQDLAEIGELNAKVTAEMAAEADAYEKNLVRLEGRKKSLYNTIAAGLLPVMVDLTDALVSAGSMTTRLNEKARELKDDNVIEAWARNALRAVAALIDVFDAVIRVVRIVGNSLAAVAADIVSVLSFMDGIGGAMIKEGSFDPVKRRFATLTSDLKSHAESFNEDMVKIWTAPLFLTKLEDQFAKRDAGLKKAVPPTPKVSFAIPDQRPDKTSPFDSYLDSLNVEAIKDKFGKYEAMVEKGRLLAVKENRLGDMAKVTDTVSSIQNIDETKRIDAFAHSLDVANQQYQLQNTLIGLNARDQALATDGRKNFLAVEQQIWDAEKNGAKLSADAQARIRAEATRTTATLVQSTNERFDAQQKFDETQRIKAFTHSLAEANQQYVFQTGLIGQNARAQEIANLARKNYLAVEQQIWEAEQSGTKLTLDTQARLREAATQSTSVMVAAINARWEAEHAWETGVSKALNNYVDNVTSAAAQSERLFTNAFKSMEDALVKFIQTGKLDFKSLANSIIADLIRIQIQNSIMKPLAQMMQGSGIIDGIKSLFGFANGGVMSADGPLALHSYAGGGVASGPQLALFGEGRMNEAFVPLPDGRSIPVKMSGQGASQIIVNINNSQANAVKASVTQSSGPLGTQLNIQIDKIESAIAANVSNGRGALAPVLSARFGLNRGVGAV